MFSAYIFNMGIKFLFVSNECDHPQVLLNSRKTVFISEYLKVVLFLHEGETRQKKISENTGIRQRLHLKFPFFFLHFQG